MKDKLYGYRKKIGGRLLSYANRPIVIKLDISLDNLKGGVFVGS